MARLIYQNAPLPNFGSANSLYSISNSAFNQAGKAVSDALDSFQDSRSAQLLAGMLQQKSFNDLQNYLSNDPRAAQLLANADPETLQFALNKRSQYIADDAARRINDNNTSFDANGDLRSQYRNAVIRGNLNLASKVLAEARERGLTSGVINLLSEGDPNDTVTKQVNNAGRALTNQTARRALDKAKADDWARPILDGSTISVDADKMNQMVNSGQYTNTQLIALDDVFKSKWKTSYFASNPSSLRDNGELVTSVNPSVSSALIDNSNTINQGTTTITTPQAVSATEALQRASASEQTSGAQNENQSVQGNSTNGQTIQSTALRDGEQSVQSSSRAENASSSSSSNADSSRADVEAFNNYLRQQQVPVDDLRFFMTEGMTPSELRRIRTQQALRGTPLIPENYNPYTELGISSNLLGRFIQNTQNRNQNRPVNYWEQGFVNNRGEVTNPVIQQEQQVQQQLSEAPRTQAAKTLNQAVQQTTTPVEQQAAQTTSMLEQAANYIGSGKDNNKINSLLAAASSQSLVLEDYANRVINNIISNSGNAVRAIYEDMRNNTQNPGLIPATTMEDVLKEYTGDSTDIRTKEEGASSLTGGDISSAISALPRKYDPYVIKKALAYALEEDNPWFGNKSISINKQVLKQKCDEIEAFLRSNDAVQLSKAIKVKASLTQGQQALNTAGQELTTFNSSLRSNDPRERAARLVPMRSALQNYYRARNMVGSLSALDNLSTNRYEQTR